MQEVLDDQEEECLQRMQQTLRGDERVWDPCAMARIDEIFKLIRVHEGRCVSTLDYRDGPLRVQISGPNLDIVLHQTSPELRGDDRELLVQPERYAPDTLSESFRLTKTSCVFMLDLQNVPRDAFDHVRVAVEYGQDTQLPFPHGNVFVLTQIGQLSTRADRAVQISVERCMLSSGFVRSLERTRYLTKLRLWNCGTLRKVTFPPMGYLHHLDMRLFHPFGGPIAEINFSEFPVLRALDWAMDARVISKVATYNDAAPGSGMLKYETQGVDKYTIVFDNLRQTHNMTRVRLHLAFEDLAPGALGLVLGFERLEKLFVEAAPPAQTHPHVGDDGDVLMATANPVVCTAYVMEQMRISTAERTPSFLERYPLEFLRAQPLAQEGIPYDRTVPAFERIVALANEAHTRMVALGRTASVLTGALGGHPGLFRAPPPRTLAQMMAGNKHIAGLALTCGPLADPRACELALTDAFARHYVCTEDPLWKDAKMRGPSDPNRTFLGRLDVQRKDLEDAHPAWDALLAPRGFFVLFTHREYLVNIPSASKEQLKRELADFTVQPPSSYCGVSGFRIFNFWPLNWIF
jgi:hypothetical protein